MFGRYRRLVPKAHRDMIKRHRLPKPNWFVGSAERPFVPDPEFYKEVERVKAEIRASVASREFDQGENDG